MSVKKYSTALSIGCVPGTFVMDTVHHYKVRYDLKSGKPSVGPKPFQQIKL